MKFLDKVREDAFWAANANFSLSDKDPDYGQRQEMYNDGIAELERDAGFLTKRARIIKERVE